MFSSIIPAALIFVTFASAAPIKRVASSADITVLQFADVLEQLETQFYTQALAKFQASDFTAAGFGNVNVPEEIFSGILKDESTHTSIIETTLIALGSQAVTGCQFNFDSVLTDVATMAATARVIENVGVSAYLGGANLIEDKQILVAAATILTVEARHQSLLNVLNTATSIPQAFDIALSPPQVLAIAGSFISGCSLGITPTPSLSVTNTGPIGPGTSLTFSSSGIPSGVDPSTLTCQMMTGGAPFALALPFNACIVPDINGPVYIYVVNGTQPLLNNQADQFSASILAGPLLTFIDSVPETLGQVVKAASSSVSSSSVISQANASALISSAQSANPAASSGATASNSTSGAGSSSGSAGSGAVSVMGWSNSTNTTSGA